MAEKIEEKAINEEEEKKIRLDWRIPEGIFTPFVTNMVVQSVDNVYKIFFFEAKPPIRLDATDPMPDSVRADCVASIVITPEKLIDFSQVLQRQAEKLKKI